MADKIRIMLVEDHQVVRQGLEALLSTTDDMEVAGSVGDGLEAVETFRTVRPDVTLIDLQLPKLGGADTIRRIRAEFPQARFIVLTTFDGDEDIYRALQAGARARDAVHPAMLAFSTRQELFSQPGLAYCYAGRIGCGAARTRAR